MTASAPGKKTCATMTELAVVTRSGVVESRHHGSVVALNADGSIAFSMGDHEAAVYPRSSTKPMLSIAMIDAGFEGSPEQLALSMASHSGEAMHLEVVHSILARYGLRVEQLGNTADLPLGDDARANALRHGAKAAPLTMNCSGKHAAMLATCVVNGWPLDGYLYPEHPLQLAGTAAVDSLTVDGHQHIGVDGCGAPAHLMSLAGLARSYRAIALGERGAHAVLRDAVLAHPDLVGGTGRDVTTLIRELGVFAKDGAEGVYAVATTDGRAVAIKIEDGSNRPRAAVVLDALALLGVDVRDLPETMRVHSLGHGQPVGAVSSVLHSLV
jgi:L-asparaginase II